MNAILNDLLNPSWWISVVVAGFIVNLLSSYTKPGIDKVWSEFSATRRKKLEEETAEFQQEIKKLLDEPSKIYDVKLDVIYYNIRAIIHMLVILAGFITSSFVFNALSQNSETEKLMVGVVSLLPLFLSFYSYYWLMKYLNRSKYSLSLIRAYASHKKEAINKNDIIH